MSRHRNVRHAIDDYYDAEDAYYDDDYYDDDEYDVDDYAPSSKSSATTSKKQQQQQKPPAVAVSKKKNVVVASPPPSSSVGGSGGGGTTSSISVIPAATAYAKSSATAISSAGGGGGGGIATPPPGFGVPPPQSIGPPTTRPPKTPQPPPPLPSASKLKTPTTQTPTTTKAQVPSPPPPVPKVLLEEAHEAAVSSSSSVGEGHDADKNRQQRKNKPTKRRNLTVVVLGHVDAGKSTVTGHLLYSASTAAASSGANNNSNSNKATWTNYGNGRKPTNFAWLLDEDEQERAHGITMDIATKTLATARYNVVLQDAPGHSDYVPATITGTATAQAAMLVVDAADYRTALESGQFKQHAFLARGLGVLQVLVVVNKMDLVGWNQHKYEEIRDSATRFLTQTVGYGVNAVRCIPVSGLAGTNIVEASSSSPASTSKKNQKENGDGAETDGELLRKWYDGPTLIDAIDSFFENQNLKSTTALLQKPLRIILTDVVGEQGKNGVGVRAKVLQGFVKNGEQLVVQPLADETTIQKLSSLHSGADALTDLNDERRLYAGAGELFDCVLTNIDVSRVLVGNTLSRPGSVPALAMKCRAKIWILEGLTIPIIRGASCVFYMHHLNVPCHLSQLIATLQKDGKTVAKKRPRALTSNTQAVVELTLSYSIVMESFDDCRSLGRFVLRRGGDSIAVGRIEQVLS